METKIEKISELSKLLSVKTRMSDDLFHLFGKYSETPQSNTTTCFIIDDTVLENI